MCGVRRTVSSFGRWIVCVAECERFVCVFSFFVFLFHFSFNGTVVSFVVSSSDCFFFGICVVISDLFFRFLFFLSENGFCFVRSECVAESATRIASV